MRDRDRCRETGRARDRESLLLLYTPALTARAAWLVRAAVQIPKPALTQPQLRYDRRVPLPGSTEAFLLQSTGSARIKPTEKEREREREREKERESQRAVGCR